MSLLTGFSASDAARSHQNRLNRHTSFSNCPTYISTYIRVLFLKISFHHIISLLETSLPLWKKILISACNSSCSTGCLSLLFQFSLCLFFFPFFFLPFLSFPFSYSFTPVVLKMLAYDLFLFLRTVSIFWYLSYWKLPWRNMEKIHWLIHLKITTMMVLWKIKLFSKLNRLSEKSITLTFSNIFKNWLNRRQLHSEPCFCIQYVVLVQVYEENLASGRYVVGKEKGILKAFQITVDILLWYNTNIQ